MGNINENKQCADFATLLFIDEISFTRLCIVYTHNERDRQLPLKCLTLIQERLSFNVWTSITGDRLVDSYLLQD